MPTMAPGRTFGSVGGAAPQGGVQLYPGNPWYDQNYRNQAGLAKSQADLSLIPGQEGEQQGLSNLEQLAEVFGLSANVTPSGTLSAATGVGMAPPPAPGSTATGTGAWSPGTPGAGAFAPPPSVAPIQMPTDTTAATMARAKDTAAQNLQGTLRTIQNQSGARGLSGSSAEQANENAAILGAGQTVSDEDTQIASDYANQQEAAATTGYQGAVTQRGQDISSSLEARGQNINAADTANALAEREWESGNQNQLSSAELALQQQGAKFSQLSALGSLLARVTPNAAPAMGASY